MKCLRTRGAHERLFSFLRFAVMGHSLVLHGPLGFHSSPTVFRQLSVSKLTGKRICRVSYEATSIMVVIPHHGYADIQFSFPHAT
jgi:hypothetical protein